MTLALIYHLILHYHIGGSKPSQLKWFNSILPDANIRNFSTDWKDGRCLACLVNHFEPGSIELSDSSKPLELIQSAMKVAEGHLHVPQIIDPEDLNKDKPDDQSVSTYLSFFNCPGSTGEKTLLEWWNNTFARHLTNFTTDWHNPDVLCELVDYFVPRSKRSGNAHRAMIVAERRLGIDRMFQPEDIANHKVDRLLLMVYVTRFQSLEVQQPYSNEEERIDSATEEEEKVVKATAVKRLSSYQREEVGNGGEEEEDVFVDACSSTPILPKSPTPVALTSNEVIAKTHSHSAENRFVTEILIKQPTVSVPPPASKEPIVTTIVVEAGPARIELPVAEPDITIETLTAEEAAHTSKLSVTELSKPNGIKNEHIPNIAGNCPPIDKAKTTNSEPEMDPDEMLMQEALEETFQHALEKKALNRASLIINFPPPPTTATTPPPSNHCETHSDNVSISISDILDQDAADHDAAEDGNCKPDRCLVTGRGLYKASVNALASFSVDCSQAGRGKLRATVLSPRGDHLELSAEATKEGVYNVRFTPKVAGNHAISLEWDRRHIPGSPFTCEVFDPAMCVVSGPGLSRGNAVVGETASFQVSTRGAGNGTISASIRGPTRPVVLMEVGHDNNNSTYYYEYDPEEPGTYVIDITWSGFAIPGSPFRVEAEEHITPMTADNVVVRNLPTQRVQVNKEVVLTVDASEASGGSLNAVAQGPSLEEACTIEEVAGEEEGLYAVKFTPREIGEYTIYVDYGECAIPDSPLPITVNDPTKCMVDTTSLPEGLQRKGTPVSLRVLTNLAGEGDLTAVAKGLDEPCQTRQESDGVWIVSYTPHSRGKHFIDIFFDNFPILKTPISFDVGDIVDQIILTKPVNRSGYYPTNKSLEFLILAPGINGGELTVAAHGMKTASTPTLAVSSSNETYTVLFTAVAPDDYKVEISYKTRQVSGSPFVLTVRDQPAPEKVITFDPVIPHISGKPVELVFDTSQAGEGSLAASITSDAGVSIVTHLKEVSPSLSVISFVPPHEGVYSAGVTWAGSHIRGSPLSLKFEVQKRDPQVCVVFESSMSLKTKLTGRVTSKSTGAVVNLNARQFERGKYQLGFHPPKRDMYLLTVFEFEKEVSGSPFTIDLLKPSQPELPELEYGKGILSVMVTGEKTGPIKPTLEYSQSTDTAKIGFLSKQRDLYKLDIFWNHKLIQGSPFNIDLSRV